MTEHELRTRLVADLREGKSKLFGERDDPMECFEYAQQLIPKEHHAAVTTAMMVHYNTVLELLAREIENGETP